MFKVSTVFIKEQIPHVTLGQLISRYKRELERQSVSNISVDFDTIYFANSTFRFVLNRYANKFSSFSNGQIKIVDTGNEFVVYVKASVTRLFISAGLIGVAVTLFFLLSSGFDIFALIVGVIAFALLAVIGYILTSVSFPVYFTSVRNDIERELQARQE